MRSVVHSLGRVSRPSVPVVQQSSRRLVHQHAAMNSVAVSGTSNSAAHPSGCGCCGGAHSAARMVARATASVAVPPASRFLSGTAAASQPLMRAQVLTHAAPEYIMGFENLRRPSPKKGEVLVKVRACGVCHSDLHVMKSEIGFPVPAVLGHEITGEIVELGEGVSAHSAVQLKVGQKVASPFIMPCGECGQCVRGMEDLCATFFALNRGKGQLYDGTTRLFRADGTPVAMYSFGGLAEYAVVPATAVFPLPENAPYVDSAILGCAVFTAYGAVNTTGRLQPGETAAVIGVGGVGTNILQMARARGADRIIAIDINDEKLELARAMGATHTINGLKENVTERLREFTDNRGVDVAFEALGRKDTFAQAVTAVTDGGRAVMVGLAPAGQMGEVEITRLVRRKIQILGAFGARARQDMPAVLRMVEKGQIDVSGTISKRFSFNDSAEAFKQLAKGQIIGRAVIDMEL